MRNKLFTKILLGVLAVFLFAGTSFAATATSVRLQQPENPTNKDTFNITFVALDTNPNQPVTVQCEKKGPGDADFVNFGSLIPLSNGGNTDVCQVNSGIVNTAGTYQFRVTANGSSTVQSNVVSVDFNNSAPGTPTNYNKTKPDNCTYKINFRTANDSGKTVKVVLYRSSETSFSLDSAHQVNSLSIGSDTDGFMTDNVSPNCSTEYFYAIRAFDVYGNGSGTVGDSNITTTIVNPTTTQTQGAIPVGGTGGSVLGTGTKTGVEKEVLGEATKSAAPTPATSKLSKVTRNPVADSVNWVLTHKKISLLILVLFGAIAYYLYRRYKSNK